MRSLAVALSLSGAVTAQESEPTFLAPRTEEHRKRALRGHSSSRHTEEAVTAGIDWLIRHQDDSGRWDADGFAHHCEDVATPCTGVGKGQHGEEIPCPFDGPISGLATLALLGRGHGPVGEARENLAVARALDALRAPPDRWSLAVAVECFAEAVWIDGREQDRDTLERLVASLLALRQEDGAFGYAAPYRPGSDVPYTALCIPGLLAARDVGFALPEDLAEGIDQFLDSLEEKDGNLAYLLDGRRYGYTPTTCNSHCALALRELLDVGKRGARHRAHLGRVREVKPLWKIEFRDVDVPGRGTMRVQISHLSMYAWWYGTLGMRRRGGSDWSAWWKALARALREGRVEDGCARGSWEPLGTYERQTGGRVMATALGVLLLEEPYRHLR